LALSPLACSLSPFNPKVPVALRLERAGPPLPEMDYYLVAVSGGSLSSSLTSANVGMRSLDCLQLGGQIFFPYTFDQITSGASLALAAGEYRFSILGFSGSAVPGAATVGQVYAGSPALKAFLLAQLTATVTPGQNVKLTASYNAPAATDLN